MIQQKIINTRKLNKIRFVISFLFITFVLTSCGLKTSVEMGTEIISAKEAITLLNEKDTILVDARSSADYTKSHLENAVNVSRADIFTNTPYPSMLCLPDQLEKIMEAKGISNTSTIVVYDSNQNMDSARLWWTLKIYGHNSIKVVSGGMNALQKKGLKVSTVIPNLPKGIFKAAALKNEMLAVKRDIKNQINNDDPNTHIIDTRSLEEYRVGTIPGSINIEFKENNLSDQRYRSARQLRNKYQEAGFKIEDTIIMFCKSSVRGAQTYLALYDAGYRNLKLYDGAWLEWSASPANPVFKSESGVDQIDSSDNS